MKKKVINYVIMAIIVLLIIIIFLYKKNSNTFVKVDKYSPIDRSLINREFVKSEDWKWPWTWENR